MTERGLPAVPAGGYSRTSLDNTWMTPEPILSCVRRMHGGVIQFDAASAPSNPTAAARFCAGAPGTMFAPTPEGDLTAHEVLARMNGLEQPWDWATWVNPPYGRELRAWLLKIERESRRLPGRSILALLPTTRWEQGYLHDVIACARAICLIRGRVAFISSRDLQPVAGNPSGSMVLGINVNLDDFAEAFGAIGRCFILRPLEVAES